MNKSVDLSGIESSKFQDDDELLKEIVKLVLKRLGKHLVNSKGLVGIDKKIADIESLIRKESKDTRLIGIWGMGGIGKTTLPQEVFNKLQSEYQGSYFLANEREQSSKDGIISLKKEIFTELLGHVVKIDTPNSLPNDTIRRMKVLIVLDDVNDSDHLEKLLGTLDHFGAGSRILITTRDEQVLNANKADEIYRLREFNFDKAFELFKLNAFNQSDNQSEYDELSQRVVNYAKGIPLVLKVLARLLRGKNKEVWESELDKLEKMPLREVCDIMKLSYVDLDRKEQQIFLDLACFFLRSQTKITIDYLNSLLKDSESDNSVVVGLERLKDKALITFLENNFISIHDSLQEMACEIVRQESTGDPGSRSRLWDLDDIYEALKNYKGNEAIRSILLHLPTTKKENLSPRLFAKMNRLRFLEVSVEDNYDCFDILAKGLKFLATELRFLSWKSYSGKSLPEIFSTEKLVILKLPYSGMEKLWLGVKNLVNLKELDLRCSKKLKELPDISKATNLEVILLRGCSMLTNVHPSIFSLPKLERLNLSDCESLNILTSNSHLRSLSYLDLDFCKNLKKFSVVSKNMKELRLGCTKVKALPSSFGHQSKLKLLHLKGSAIKRLPSSFNNLTQLLHLDVKECKSLQSLPELSPSLEILNARDCESLMTVLFPSTAVEQLKENRKQVMFWNCLNLDEHSLVAIGLNAQINMMKFANHHLSTPNREHVENYNDSFQVVYMYPGSSVPGWLEYKTRNYHITIDLSSAPPSPQRSFVFCFVLGEFQRTDIIRTLEFSITMNEGEGKEDSVSMYIDYLGWSSIESDHVCVMYDQRCSEFLWCQPHKDLGI
ncbi:disease resistance protein RUN1 [Glycine max]|uniref:disease resistance protein RUN1 n=1 Tax=Glycine max TaxID=3847 RepID=UPI001B354944|nr:disease resistance protein RUN1 [Glycine max]